MKRGKSVRACVRAYVGKKARTHAHVYWIGIHPMERKRINRLGLNAQGTAGFVLVKL